MDSSPQQTVDGVPLLETRLYIPRWRPGLVSRRRLIERLDQGAERKLTLVSAPAGFGKTTLLAEWLATSPAGERPAAWVSLDPGDNDPVLFWAYVSAALQRVRPGLGATALALLRSPQPPPIEAVVTTLINEATAIEDDFALILDDFHLIDAQPVLSAIGFLLDHLPPRMHLVIASRADPALPLARLRARGESIELRVADLRFTPGEAASFLTEAMGLDLAAADVTALETRTEGWIAGLQLAALSMQGRDDVAGFIRSFAGNHRYIVDYLVEEVLQRQPEPVRRFLLQTSVLDRLSGPLCDAVTGLTNGTGTLETLERGNLFVVPLDDTRHWYRYHHLFVDVLRAHALEKQPDRIPDLHRRASTWFEQRGMAAEAIDQARAAGDHDTVARLLATHWEDFDRIGRNASISRWAASLPEEMIRTRPRLALIYAASSLAADNTNQTARRLTSWAEDAISLMEGRGGFDPSDDVDKTVVGPDGLDALKGELLALKIMHSSRNLSAEETLAITGQAITLMPRAMHRVRSMLHMMRAGTRMEQHDLESGLPDVERGVDEARRARNPALLASMLSHRGQTYVDMGRLEDGRRSFEEALLAGQEASAEAAMEMCSPLAGLAGVLLEVGDLAAASAHAARAPEFAATAPTRSPVLYARATVAQVMLAAGDTEAAFVQLAEAQEFVRGSSDTRFHPFLSSFKLKVHCGIGDLDAAADVARERGLSPDMAVDSGNVEEANAYARYLIGRGDGEGAARVLSRVLPIAQGRGWVQHEIRALVLQAQAHELAGHRALALESLGRATMLGEPGGYNRTLTAEGSVMTGLLDALPDAVRSGRGPSTSGSPSYLTSLLGEARAGSKPSSARSSMSELPEPLTRREIEILQLIAAGLRNQEIADRLFISLPTVKRHIANAYGKLGVGHRTEAVARARELNLL